MAVFCTDVHGRSIYVSEALKRLIGRTPEGLDWAGGLHPEDRDRVLNAHIQATCEQKPCTVAERYVMPDKTYRWFRADSVPQFDPAGAFLGFVGGLREIHGPENLADSASNWFRCRRSTCHPLRLPTLAFSMDGVICNTVQNYIDRLCLSGEQGYNGITDWRNMTDGLADLQCGDCPGQRSPGPTAERLIRIVQGTAFAWLEVEPFPDVPLQDLHESMDQGVFIGHFLASRYFLSTPQAVADPRYLSRQWFKHQMEKQAWSSQFDCQSILADVCRQRQAELLEAMGTDCFLTDDPDQVIAARYRGIAAYLMDRPWNRDVPVPFRVASIDEFLACAGVSDRAYTNTLVDAL